MRQIRNELHLNTITTVETCKSREVWLGDNMHINQHSLVVGVGTQLHWQVRNNRIFEQTAYTPLEVAWMCDYWVVLITMRWKTGQLGQEAPSSAQQSQLIGWWPGNEGWYILNTDGSLWSNSGHRSAAARGIIHNDQGYYVKAFTINMGSWSITRVEMTRIVDGLELAWSLGIRRICVQSDSKVVIAIRS